MLTLSPAVLHTGPPCGGSRQGVTAVAWLRAKALSAALSCSCPSVEGRWSCGVALFLVFGGSSDNSGLLKQGLGSTCKWKQPCSGL